MTEPGLHHCILSLGAALEMGVPPYARLALDGRGCAALDRDELSELALQSQRVMLLGTVAGGYVHDLSTMLMAIDLITFSAVAQLPEGHPARVELEHVRVASESARAMAGQLLAFVRRRPPAPRPIELRTLLERSLALMARLLGRGVTLRAELATDLWLVLGEPVQIEQILMNMLTNARNAMPHGGTVTVEATNLVAGPAEGVEPGEYVCLRIADTGVGMSEATLARLFEPFFTGDLAGESTGLGLPTCKYLVERLGGAVQVASSPGEGTTFRVYLPRATAELETRMHG